MIYPLLLAWDDVILEEVIPAYQTANVKGRAFLTPKLQTQTVPARHGDLVLYEQFTPREIEVSFVIRTNGSREYRTALDQLQLFLYSGGKDAEFQFIDEPGWTRYGRVSAFSEPPVDSFNGSGSFTIHCQDPFAHTRLMVASSDDGSIQIPDDAGERGYPALLRFLTLSGNVSAPGSVLIENETQNQRIRLLDLPQTGALSIERDHIYLNGEVIDEHLDVAESTWKTFPLYFGDQMSVSGVEGLRVKYEGLK